MTTHGKFSGFVSVKGARQHNLKNIDVEIPRGVLVVFTGVSGSGKSSLAFGTLYAEAQRRYLESVAPYARRLFDQMGIPEVDSIDGLPPAVALQQQRGSSTTRSSVGSVTTLSNLLRMLYSRAGTYPPGQPELHGEAFSTNSPEGACPHCHGIGRVYDATEHTMVPDDSLTIRERAIAAWPTAWGGQNQRDILVTLGYDVDRPWRELPKKDRDWILFTEEQPTVPVYAGFTPEETRRALKRKDEPGYQGTFTGVRRYLLHTLAHTESALTRKRTMQFLVSAECSVCHGKRLRPESLSVKFAGLDIAEISALPLIRLDGLLRSAVSGASSSKHSAHPERAMVAQRVTDDLVERIAVMLDLGLGYLSLERSTPTLSPGELQRLRLATQIRSNLFGVVYVLDEPSAGLHPADTEALLVALDRLKASGNSLFVVEHEVDVIRHADWIVDIGPAAGEHGGQVLYSGPLKGLESIRASRTRPYLFGENKPRHRACRTARRWLRMEGVTRNNLKNLSVAFPLETLIAVTGVSGSGKSSLVSQALVELVGEHLGHSRPSDEVDADPLSGVSAAPSEGRIIEGLGAIKRLVQVDQKPIGRTPRSNLATYTGLFDHVRRIFAETKAARARHYTAGRFSFNVAQGRCETCEGEGFVCVELLFMPSVYAPCTTCHGARYNAQTLEIQYRGKNIAEVLAMTVDGASQFFAEQSQVSHALAVLQEVGVGYLRLGQPATELSGGEAQRIKLATELQRNQRGNTLYVLDEPTTGRAVLQGVVAKFTEGAWITLLLIPGLILMMRLVKRHFDYVAGETDNGAQLSIRDLTPPIVVITIDRWSRITQKALRFAMTISPDVLALHVDYDQESDTLASQWAQLVDEPARRAGLAGPRLVILKSPYRFVIRPILDYALDLEKNNPGRQIAVLTPELVEFRWYLNLLHNHRSAALKALLLFQGDRRIMVINIPWYLTDQDARP